VLENPGRIYVVNNCVQGFALGAESSGSFDSRRTEVFFRCDVYES